MSPLLKWALGGVATLLLGLSGFLAAQVWAHGEDISGLQATDKAQTKQLDRIERDVHDIHRHLLGAP